MNDSLAIQSAKAAEFIAASWPVVREKAKDVLANLSSEIDALILCGCGDSYHAALGLEMAIAIWTSRRVQAVPAMKAARYLIPELGSSAKKTLMVGISASGEVARTREALELGDAFGAHTLALTGAEQSSLAKTAQRVLSLSTSDFPPGPGLLSYLASLLMGFAIIDVLMDKDDRLELERILEELPEVLKHWREEQVQLGEQFAADVQNGTVVFLGSGPAYGSALFAAAKLIEAAGVSAWGQDMEEWAHLEYFCEPSNMATWLLSSGGRGASREAEIEEAARAIGRRVIVSTWRGGEGWSPKAREALAPLGLWAGPVTFARRVAQLLGEEPFRGFGGGRSREEGGGMSRIRSSKRMSPENAIHDWN